MQRDKMILLSSQVDDSIINKSIVYEIQLYKSYAEFEEYSSTTPIIVSSLVLNSDDFPFTKSNMERLIKLLDSAFTKINKVTYLLNTNVDIEKCTEFLQANGLENVVILYQVDKIDYAAIADVVDGKALDSEETITYEVTVRMRNDEFIRGAHIPGLDGVDVVEYKDDEFADVDLVPLPDANYTDSANRNKAQVVHVVGIESIERTSSAFILAQYCAMKGKTLILERDVDYHTILDMATKSGVDMMYVSIKELIKDTEAVLDRCRSSVSNLIVVGSKERLNYSYTFIFDILKNNLIEDLKYIVRESDCSEMPYKQNHTVVCKATIPSVLKTIESLVYPMDTQYTRFMVVQDQRLGLCNLNSPELKSILKKVTRIELPYIDVVNYEGLKLGGAIHDLRMHI